MTVEDSALVTAYTEYFSDSLLTKSTILIPCHSSETLNNALISIVEKRMDANAIVGYPKSSLFTKAAITTFSESLTPGMFGIFYAGRDLVTVGGVKVVTSCVGGIAGRYCAVTAMSTINQVPSAQAWGRYPGSLVESLKPDEVPDLLS